MSHRPGCLPGTCESCLDPVKYPYDFPPFYEGACNECWRRIHGCLCTCRYITIDIEGQSPPADPFDGSLSYVDMVEKLEGDPPEPDDFVCECPNADDGMSIASKIQTKVHFGWIAQTVELMQKMAAALNPAGGEHIYVRFYRTESTGTASCPTSLDGYTLLENEDGGIFMDPAFTEIEFDLDLPPVVVPGDETTPPIRNCDLPSSVAFMVEIRGNDDETVLLKCPGMGEGNTYECPPCEPGPCCLVSVVEDELLTYAEPPDPDLVEVHATVEVDCGPGCVCSAGAGTITIQLTGSGAGVGPGESFPFTGTHGDTVSVTSFRPAVNPENMAAYTDVRVTVEWACDDEDPICPAGVNCVGDPAGECPRPATDMYEFPIPIP